MTDGRDRCHTTRYRWNSRRSNGTPRILGRINRDIQSSEKLWSRRHLREGSLRERPGLPMKSNSRRNPVEPGTAAGVECRVAGQNGSKLSLPIGQRQSFQPKQLVTKLGRPAVCQPVDQFEFEITNERDSVSCVTPCPRWIPRGGCLLDGRLGFPQVVIQPGFDSHTDFQGRILFPESYRRPQSAQSPKSAKIPATELCDRTSWNLNRSPTTIRYSAVHVLRPTRSTSVE